MPKSAADIQLEIERARASLAGTVDELADRTSPKRLAEDAKQSLVARAQTPKGMLVIGGTSALIVLIVVRNLRKAKRSRGA